MASNPEIPEALIKSFFNEGVIGFIGSGPSNDSGLVNWKNLLELMRDEIELTQTEFEFVNYHITKESYLIVADFLREKMTDNQFAELMEQQFLDKKPGNLHRAILSLPLQGIITTNYDLLLSESDSIRKFKSPFIWQDTSILSKIKHSPFLLHAHGIANDYKSIILTATDYDHIRFSKEANQFWDVLKNIFIDHRILFIGYSLNDLDFNIFLRELRYRFQGFLRDQFVLIVQNKEERDPLKTRHLMRTGIRPIYIQRTTSVGESLLAWLNKLQQQIENKKKYEITPVIESNTNPEDLKQLIEQITPLLEPLIGYLSAKYSTIEIINDVLENIKVQDRIIPNQNIEKFWKDYLYSSIYKNYIEFRNFIIFIAKKDTQEKLLPRILSHLYPLS